MQLVTEVTMTAQMEREITTEKVCFVPSMPSVKAAMSAAKIRIPALLKRSFKGSDALSFIFCQM